MSTRGGQTGGQKTAWSDDRTAIQLALGNPSDARPDENQRTNFLIQRPQYSLSYNEERHTANWVSWHVEAADLGTVERGKFAPDQELPVGFYPVTPRDYTGSGMDRGHLCPSADRTGSYEDNDAVFSMINIIPQAPGNNQGPWKLLEDATRDWVREGNEVYVVAGVNGRKGGNKGTIGKKRDARIVVPETVWKILLVLPEQTGNDLARINGRTRAVAVIMPNVSSIRGDRWEKYRVSIADVERETGLRFLTSLPDNIAQDLKQKADD
jgi:endonuclease G, mitochondrial